MIEMITLGFLVMVITATSYVLGWRAAQNHQLQQDIDFFNDYNFDDMFSDTPIGDQLGRKYDV